MEDRGHLSALRPHPGIHKKLIEDFRFLHRRSKVRNCSECNAFEENTDHDFVRKQICATCEWGMPYFNPYLDRLRHFLGLQDACCPVGRHELTDADWLILGILRSEREKIIAEEAKRGS